MCDVLSTREIIRDTEPRISFEVGHVGTCQTPHSPKRSRWPVLTVSHTVCANCVDAASHVVRDRRDDS